MFNDLFIFEKNRTAKEAFGFYLTYFAMTLLGSLTLGLIGDILGFLDGDNAYTAGWIGSIIFCLILSFGILFKKKLLTTGFVLVAILSGFFAFLGGGLLGLIPIAYLTTINKKIEN